MTHRWEAAALWFFFLVLPFEDEDLSLYFSPSYISVNFDKASQDFISTSGITVTFFHFPPLLFELAWRWHRSPQVKRKDQPKTSALFRFCLQVPLLIPAKQLFPGRVRVILLESVSHTHTHMQRERGGHMDRSTERWVKCSDFFCSDSSVWADRVKAGRGADL